MELHGEMELFVGAGFSELDTLRAATLTAARALGREDLGQMKSGAAADVLVLNTNTVKDIKNTQDTHRIVKGGRVYSQEEILCHVPSNQRIAELAEEFLNGIYSRMQSPS